MIDLAIDDLRPSGFDSAGRRAGGRGPALPGALAALAVALGSGAGAAGASLQAATRHAQPRMAITRKAGDRDMGLSSGFARLRVWLYVRRYAPALVAVAIERSPVRMRATMPATLPGSSLPKALLVALLAGGCTPSQRADPGPDAGTAPDASPAASAMSTALEPAEARGGDEIRPVYPIDAGPPDPLAARFCDAVLVAPERRRSECCSTPNLAGIVAGQCVRALTFALAQHTVTLAPADVDRCAEAVTRASAGCDWVIPDTTALPPECEGLVKGALAEKARCRSSLECREGLRCMGLSTVDLGVCAPPKPARSQCNVAIDMLATFTRQNHVDRDHPECEGYCGHAQCEPVVAAGGACATDRACGRGRCSAGKCTSAPLPALGEVCTEAWAPGRALREGQVRGAEAADGDTCELDAECRGTCVRGDGGTAGACVKSCPVFTVPRLPAPVPPPAMGKPGGPAPRRR